MEPSKLHDHDFNKGIFQTKLSQLVTTAEESNDWIHARSVEYIWLALILHNQNRSIQLQKCMKIISLMIKNTNLETLSMSTILNLSINDEKYFITILKEENFLEFLFPLTLVLSDSQSYLKKNLIIFFQ